MIKVVKFQLHHIVGFEPRENYENLEYDMRCNLSDPSRDLVSIVDDKEVIAIAGLNNLRSGVGEIWIICSKKVEEKPLSFFKLVKNIIDDLCFNMMGFHRLQMSVEYGNSRNFKWAEKLGFELEGILRKYDAEGNNHLLLAKVR